MSRPRWQLRDAALGYACRGIPVLPLHYPLPHRPGLQPVGGDQQPGVGSGCSCRDPHCGQPAKHPLGSLVPHGVKDATTNRARILAWWTRHPQANIGLATGHRFDVLDVDGPEGAQAIRELAAAHGFQSSGPLVRTGGGGWHFYLAPTGLGNVHPWELEHVDWRGRGGYVVAPPSRHASGHPYQWAGGRDLNIPAAEVPSVLLERLQPRQLHRPIGSVQLPAAGDGPGERYARAALAEELARVAAAPIGLRNRQLWESTRNLYNLVATGALEPREVDRGLLAAAERCGLLGENHGRPAGPWPRAARSAWPIPAAPASPPAPNAPMPRHPRQLERPASGPRRGGDGYGRNRPAGRLALFQGGRVPPPSRARAHPTTPQEGACMGSHPTLAQQDRATEARELDHRGWSDDHTHNVREAEAERAFDRLNPDFGVPADRHNPHGRQAVRDREAALALGSGWPSTTAAKTTGTRSSGSPARTTAWPTLSTPPGLSPSGSAGARIGSGPNAEPPPARSSTMAADNHTTIVGNLIEDPELRFTNTGIAVANLRVAVTQRIQQDGEWRDGDTSFLKVNVWRGQAEHLADSLGKGDRVMVTGRLRQRSWETPEGEKRSVTEIEADEVGASLKWATAKVERSSQRGNGDRTQGPERQAERGADFNDAPPF